MGLVGLVGFLCGISPGLVGISQVKIVCACETQRAHVTMRARESFFAHCTNARRLSLGATMHADIHEDQHDTCEHPDAILIQHDQADTIISGTGKLVSAGKSCVRLFCAELRMLYLTF